MRVAVLVRVSTSKQGEGTSLETQLEACLRMVESEGYHGATVDVLREEWSGADPDRPVLRKLRQDIADGKYTAVFILDTDRMVRHFLLSMIFRYECEEAGVALHLVYGQAGTSDEDRLVQMVEGYAAQKEREKISERTTRGKLATARAGRMPVGTALYGYDYDKVTKKRTINAREAAVVKRIFEMSAAGIGVRRIARILASEGIATKRGGQWDRCRVWKMLRNESYAGVDFYRQTSRPTVRGRRGKLTARPREEWIRIEGFSPPIISAALFAEVQEGLTMGGERQPALRRAYLLTLFLWCSKCGKHLHGNSRAGSPRRYLCAGCRRVGGLPARCNEPKIDADELEALVWDQLVAAITHPDVLANGLRPHLETGEPDSGREMARLTGEIKKCRNEEGKLIDLYKEGDFDLQLLKGKVAEARLLRAEHERDLLLLEKQQAFIEDPAEKQRGLEEHARRIRQEMATMDFDAKVATLYAFGVKIVVGEGKVSIELFVDPS